MKVIDLVYKQLRGEEMPKNITITKEIITDLPKIHHQYVQAEYNPFFNDYRIGRYQLKFKDMYLFEYVFSLGDNLSEMINHKDILNYEVTIDKGGEDNNEPIQ